MSLNRGTVRVVVAFVVDLQRPLAICLLHINGVHTERFRHSKCELKEDCHDER